MTMSRDFANGKGWVDDLLLERRYRDWFWEGLPDNGRVLRRDSNPKITCTYCKVPKYRSEFNLNDHPTVKRCNQCILTRRNVKGPTRWQRTGSLEWQGKASCQGVDFDVVFYPVDQAGRLSARKWQHPRAQWRRYCTDCPVLAECEAFAWDSKSTGIWAGKLFVRYGNGGVKVLTGTRRSYPYNCHGLHETHLIQSSKDHYYDGTCKQCKASANQRKGKEHGGGTPTHIP